MIKNVTGTLAIPIALLRNRIQCVTDVENSTPDTTVYGDAAFADYLINFTLAVRIPNRQKEVFISLYYLRSQRDLAGSLTSFFKLFEANTIREIANTNKSAAMMESTYTSS